MTASSANASDLVAAVTSVPGAIDAVADAPGTIAKIFDLAGRLIYGTSYATAFFIAFPVELIVAAIPTGNALVRGIIDGTWAARDRAQRIVG